MKKKLFTSFVLAGLVAFGAQAQEFEGNLYIQDATIFSGESTNLSIQLENNIDVCGFQFDLTFPKGVSVSALTVSAGRKASGADAGNPTIGDPVVEGDQVSYHFAVAYDSSKPFTGNSGEVAKITINAADDIELGQYTCQMTRVYVTKAIDTFNPPVESSTFTLSVTSTSYDEGYAVEVLPFAMNENSVDENLLVNIPITMVNKANVKSFEFELQLPSSFIESFSYFDEDGVKISLTGFTSTIGPASADGTISVSATPNRPTYKVNAGTTDIGVLPLFYENGLIPAGVYPITIKNIKLTGSDGNTYFAAPYATEIYVGDAPKATVTDGVVAFHGNYGETEGFELLKASLPEGATIDLTEVSDLAEDPSELRTDNVIVAAETISYGRAMSNEWGSLCLPFALESDDNIQLYELKSVSGSTMSFDPVASVEANTPVIFKASGDGFTVKTANDGGFDFGFSTTKPRVDAIDNWVLNGSYSEETIDVSGIQAYGLMNNEFHRFTKTLTAGAFRAWLQNNGEPMNATIRIEDSTEGISIVEQEDGSVKLIFDIQGRQLKDNVGQQMIIENGHKLIRSNK